MTTREDESQPVIFELTIGNFWTDTGVFNDEVVLGPDCDVASTSYIDCPTPSHRREPRTGTGGYALLTPGR